RESEFAEPTGESNMSSAKRDSSGASEEGEIKDGSASIDALTGSLDVLTESDCYFFVEQPLITSAIPYDRYKAHGGELFVFYDDIPANTTLDLLEFHDDLTLRDMLNNLEEETKDELLPRAPLFGTEPASLTERRKKATPNKVLQQSCISAREVIEGKYITFTRLCDEYHRRFMGAKLTAEEDNWFVTRHEGTTYISKMQLYDSGWGIRPVGRMFD
ncbi:hypothetical protein FOZ62_001468, partial [Perkinsus olseni]